MTFYRFAHEVYETADRIGVQIPDAVKLFDFPDIDHDDEGTFLFDSHVRRAYRSASRYRTERSYVQKTYRSCYGKPKFVSFVKRASRRADRRLSRAIARDALRDG